MKRYYQAHRKTSLDTIMRDLDSPHSRFALMLFVGASLAIIVIAITLGL